MEIYGVKNLIHHALVCLGGPFRAVLTAMDCFIGVGVCWLEREQGSEHSGKEPMFPKDVRN